MRKINKHVWTYIIVLSYTFFERWLSIIFTLDVGIHRYRDIIIGEEVEDFFTVVEIPNVNSVEKNGSMLIHWADLGWRVGIFGLVRTFVDSLCTIIMITFTFKIGIKPRSWLMGYFLLSWKMKNFGFWNDVNDTSCVTLFSWGTPEMDTIKIVVISISVLSNSWGAF